MGAKFLRTRFWAYEEFFVGPRHFGGFLERLKINGARLKASLVLDNQILKGVRIARPLEPKVVSGFEPLLFLARKIYL